MSVSLTPAAARHVEKSLAKRGSGIGLRLAVKTSGCSGFAYALEFVDTMNDDDQCFETHGMKVIVDSRSLGMLVVHTKECHRPDLSDCPPAKRRRGRPSLRIGDPGTMGRILIDGEAGADFVPELAPQPGDVVIAKPGKGAFYATPLSDALAARRITHLIFGGVTTEVCVQTTMREANDRGYECLLVEEATGSYFPEFKAQAIAMIRAQGGIVGWTATLAAVRSV